MNFKSDNTVCANPEILEAMAKVNHGHQASYGNDEYSKKLLQKVREVFETDCEIFLVNTGTAANSLSLKAMAPSYGIVYCTDIAHINTDETSAPEFFTGGVKLKPVPDENGKLRAEYLTEMVEHAQAYAPHAGLSKAISITQSTEYGTVYSEKEIEEIHSQAYKHQLYLHMDGARFTNALTSLDIAPANMTWKRGVDILSLGATKNGAIMGEMIVIFDKKLANEFAYYHKQAGQLMSKTRYFSSQFLAWFDNDLWLKNARHANKMASLLKEGIDGSSDIKTVYPVEANELFIKMNKSKADSILAKGAEFYQWHGDIYRLVTNWTTTEEEVKEFLSFT